MEGHHGVGALLRRIAVGWLAGMLAMAAGEEGAGTPRAAGKEEKGRERAGAGGVGEES